MLDYIKSVLYKKSIKTILNVYINNLMFIVIKFKNYTISRKINTELRHFLGNMQHINIKKISKEEKYCIPQLVGFYDIFGIVEGDIIELSSNDGYSMNIMFQSVQ